MAAARGVECAASVCHAAASRSGDCVGVGSMPAPAIASETAGELDRIAREMTSIMDLMGETVSSLPDEGSDGCDRAAALVRKLRSMRVGDPAGWERAFMAETSAAFAEWQRTAAAAVREAASDLVDARATALGAAARIGF